MEKELSSKQSLSSSRGRSLVIENYNNGIYNGHKNKGLCHGKGVFWWDSGELYFGEWEETKIHGEGILFFPYGGYLKGFFFKNKINGAAFLKFPNGDFYQGFWRHGKLDGKCFKYFADFNSWALCTYSKGIFQKCLNKGRGQPNISFEERLSMHIDSTFVEQEGNHVGVIYYGDGGKYYGVIQGGIPHGLGITYYRDGKFDAGLYQNGVLHGAGRLIIENGDICEGYIKEGRINGKGFFYKKEVDMWIFGNFIGQNDVNVLKKGKGFPLEEISIIFCLNQIIIFLKVEWKRKTQLLNLPRVNLIIPNDLFFIPLLEEPGEEAKKRMQRSPGPVKTAGISQYPSRMKINPAEKLFEDGDEYRRLLNFDVTPSDSSKSNKFKQQILSSNSKEIESSYEPELDSEKALLEQNLEKDREMLEQAGDDEKKIQSKLNLHDIRADTNSNVQAAILENLSENLQHVAAGLRLSLKGASQSKKESEQEGITTTDQSALAEAKPKLDIQNLNKDLMQQGEEGLDFEYVYKKIDSPSPKAIDFGQVLMMNTSNQNKEGPAAESQIPDEKTDLKSNQESSPETGTRRYNRTAPSFDLDAEKRNQFFTTEENLSTSQIPKEGEKVVSNNDESNSENPFKAQDISAPKDIVRVTNQLDSPEFSRVRSKDNDKRVNPLNFNALQSNQEQKPTSPTNKHYRAQSVQPQEINDDSISLQSVSRSELDMITNHRNSITPRGFTPKANELRKSTLSDDIEDNQNAQSNKDTANQTKIPKTTENEIRITTNSNSTPQESSAEFADNKNANIRSELNEIPHSKAKSILEDKEIQTDFQDFHIQQKSTPRKIATFQNYFSEIPIERESGPREIIVQDKIEFNASDNTFEILKKGSSNPEKLEKNLNDNLDLSDKPVNEVGNSVKSNQRPENEDPERVIEESGDLNFRLTQKRVTNDQSKKEEVPIQPLNKQFEKEEYHKPQHNYSENLLKSQKGEDFPQVVNSNMDNQDKKLLNLGSKNSITEDNSNPMVNRRISNQSETSSTDQNYLNSVPFIEKNRPDNSEQSKPSNRVQAISENVFDPPKITAQGYRSPYSHIQGQPKYFLSPGAIKQRHNPADSYDSTKNFTELSSNNPSVVSNQLPAVYTTSIYPSPRQNLIPEQQGPYLNIYLNSNSQKNRNPSSSSNNSEKKSLIVPADEAFNLRAAHDALDNILKRAKFIQSGNHSEPKNWTPTLSGYFGQYQKHQDPTRDQISAKAQDLRSENDKFSKKFLPDSSSSKPFLNVLSHANASPIRRTNNSNLSNLSSRDISFHESRPANNISVTRSPNKLIEHKSHLLIPSSNRKIVQNTSLEDIPPSKRIGPALVMSPERRSNNSLNYSPIASRPRDNEQVSHNLSSFAKRGSQQPENQISREESRLTNSSNKQNNTSSHSQDSRKLLDPSRLINYNNVRHLQEDERSYNEDQKDPLIDDNIFEKAPDQRPMFDRSVLRLKKEFPIPYADHPISPQEQTSRYDKSDQDMSPMQLEKKNWAVRINDDSDITDSRIDSVGRLTEDNFSAVTPRTFNHDNFVFTPNADSRPKLSVREQNPIAVYENISRSRFESDVPNQDQNIEQKDSLEQSIKATGANNSKYTNLLKLDLEKFKKYVQSGLSQIEENVDESVTKSLETLSMSKRKQSPLETQEDVSNFIPNYSKVNQPLAEQSTKERYKRLIFDSSSQPLDNVYRAQNQLTEPKRRFNNSRTDENRPQVLGADSLDAEDRKIIKRSPVKMRYVVSPDQGSLSYMFSKGQHERTSSELEIEQKLNSIAEKAKQDLARRQKQNDKDNCKTF